MLLRVEAQDFHSILTSLQQPNVSMVTRNGVHISQDAQVPSHYQRQPQASSHVHGRLVVDGGEEEEEDEERGRESGDEPDGAFLPR